MSGKTQGVAEAPGSGAGRPAGPNLTVIRPRRGWGLPDLREVWRYRELMWFFAWRDVKARYKQRVLGVLWAVIVPLVSMVVFTLVFGRFAGQQKELGDIPYPVFAYAGLLPWLLFSASALRSSNSVVASSHVITKVYFPRVLTPLSSVGVSLVDFGISLCILLALMVFYGVRITPALLMIVPLTVLVLCAALGIGLLAGALNVAYRDVGQAVAFLVQTLFFLTPVAYVPRLVEGEGYRWLLLLNPMAGIIGGYRCAILRAMEGFGSFDWPALGVAAAGAVLLLVVGTLCFHRLERYFADVI